MNEESKEVYCSFCGISDSKVSMMVSGDDSLICANCIEVCRDVLGEWRTRRKIMPLKKQPEAEELNRKLDVADMLDSDFKRDGYYE